MQLVPLKHPNLFSILYAVTLLKTVVYTLTAVKLQNTNILIVYIMQSDMCQRGETTYLRF